MFRVFFPVAAVYATSGSKLSDAETASLIAAAGRWRSGLANGTQDLGRAVEMYRLAVARGSGRGARHGAYELAALQETGCRWPTIDASAAGKCPVDRDVASALRIYGEAAGAGHPSAQRALGVAFGSGAFVLGNADENEALDAYAHAHGTSGGALQRDDAAVLHEYFAATGRDSLGAMALGARHLAGRGVPKSCDAALAYYETAADAAVFYARLEGTLRPNERTRLDVDESAPAASRSSLVRLGNAWTTRVASAAALWVGGSYVADNHHSPENRVGAVPAPAPWPISPDEPWLPVLGAPAWRDADPFWGVGGAPARGSEVLLYYRHAAEAGDAAAQLALGHLHYHGSRGVVQDVARAAHYFELAAEAGNDPVAFGWAGLVYAQGLGVPTNAVRAETFLRRGEAQGDATALDGLGLLSLRELGSGRNARHDAAAAYFRQASEKGHPAALYHLGLMHIGWDGNAAAEDGALDALTAMVAQSSGARRQRGITVKLRRFRRDAQKALQFFSLAAQNGHIRALRQVGRIYARGLGVARSCEVAASAFRTVAERGPWVRGLADAHAAFMRGDVQGARRAYAALAEAGYEAAEANTAWLLEAAASVARHAGMDCDGLLPSTCEAAARDLYIRAAKQGDARASLRLGDLLLYKDPAHAITHYQAALELRSARAAFALGWCYQHGIGVPRDLHLAKRHYGLAADADADAAWPVRLAVAFLYAEWGLQELARRCSPAFDATHHVPATTALLAALAAILAAKVARNLGLGMNGEGNRAG